jgi:hypothetical protein
MWRRSDFSRELMWHSRLKSLLHCQLDANADLFEEEFSNPSQNIKILCVLCVSAPLR